MLTDGDTLISVADASENVKRVKMELQSARALLRTAIRQAYANGDTVAEIANFAGIARPSVYSYLGDSLLSE